MEAHHKAFKDEALSNVEVMLETGYTKMTIKQQKKKNNPLKLPPVALRLLGEWYEEKKAASGGDFEKKADERKLTRAVQAENMEAHATTHGKLDDLGAKQEWFQLSSALKCIIGRQS